MKLTSLFASILLIFSVASCTAENPKPSFEPSSKTTQLFAQEKATQNHAQVALTMFCFWTGEMKLGAIEGVINTEAGWVGSHEVTLVTYDKTAIDFPTLVEKATAINCAKKIHVPAEQLKTAKSLTNKSVAKLTGYRKAKTSDQKKQLQGTPFAKLTLTPAQSTKVNSFARTNQSRAKAYLTPEQIKQL